jgi:CRISPR/Cas system-associated exonuclease Cas4 (RecB family)
MPILKSESPEEKAPRLYDDKFPSVTEVLSVIYKPHIERWRKNVGHAKANAISQAATSLGTSVHTVCEQRSLGKDVNLPEDDKLMVMSQGYLDFLDDHVDEILLTEQRLVSERLGIGGTVDAYVRLHTGEHAVVDIKTSKNFSPEMGLQMAGYAMMLEEMGHTVDKRIIVRLSKDRPGKHYVKVFDDPQDFPAFVCARNLWLWRKKWAFDHLQPMMSAPEFADHPEAEER